MNQPIQKGERVVVNGNLQAYATAIVNDCTFVASEARWKIVLEWPKAPGGGSSVVWDTDENNVWYRYSEKN